MVDEADRSLMDAEVLEAAEINLIRNKVANMAAGEPGDCEHCGEHFSRLVGGHCGRCRDLLKLP